MRPLLASLAGVLLLGAAQPPAPPPGAAPTPAAPPSPVKLFMRGEVNPAAELYWKAAGEEDTAEGEHHRAPGPEDEARWKATVQAALTLQESGRRLQTAEYARDGDRWMRFARQLTAAGVQAEAAARARSEEKTFAAGSALYDACFACHAVYIPRPANSLYKQHLPDDAFKEPK